MAARLPEELLDLVCGHLRLCSGPDHSHENHIKLKTLAGFSLASKAFNRIARSHLYHLLDLYNTSALQRRRFLRTILEHPEYAVLVHRAYAGEWQIVQRAYHELFVDLDAQRDLDQEEKSSVLSMASDLSVWQSLNLEPGRKSWLEFGLRRRWQDAEMALVLALCTNINHLELPLHPDFLQSIAWEISREANHIAFDRSGQLVSQKSLQQLTELHFRPWRQGIYLGFDLIEDILQLPTIKAFRSHMMICDDPGVLTPSFRSTAKEVFLQDSRLDERGLQWLLASFQMLTAFSMHWTDAKSAISLGAHHDQLFERIGQVLRRLGTNLRVLRLQPQKLFHPDLSSLNASCLGSLQGLASLETLEVPIGILLPKVAHTDDDKPQGLVDSLPASLKTLEIAHNGSDDPKCLVKQLLLLMQDRRHSSWTEIKLNPAVEFPTDPTDLGWIGSKTNEAAVVLKRPRTE